MKTIVLDKRTAATLWWILLFFLSTISFYLYHYVYFDGLYLALSAMAGLSIFTAFLVWNKSKGKVFCFIWILFCFILGQEWLLKSLFIRLNFAINGFV